MNDIEQNLKNIENELQLIRQKLNPYCRITDAYWKNGNIVVEYETNADIDIFYGYDNNVYKVEDNIGKIDQSKGKFTIGVNKHDKDWWVQVVGIEVVSEIEHVGSFNEEEYEETAGQIKHMAWGWWDSFNPKDTFQDYPFSNTLRTYADNVDHALSTDADYIIPTLGFGKNIDDLTEHRIRQKLRHRGRHFENETRDRVPWVIIQDEPGAWTQEQLELVIRLAEEEINPDLYYTYSFSGTHILKERPLPRNAKIVHWNHYPFKEETYPTGWEYVDSKEGFMRNFDMAVEKVKTNMPEGVLMSITTQTFAQKWNKDDRWIWHWAHPHTDSPLWYAEAMSKHGFVGGLHYLYKSDKADVVAIDMPDLMDTMQKVYGEISEKV